MFEISRILHGAANGAVQMRSFAVLAVLTAVAQGQGQERDSNHPFDDVVLEHDSKTWPSCAHYGGVPSVDVDHMCCAKKCGTRCGVNDLTCLEGDPTGSCCLELPSHMRGDSNFTSLQDVGGHTCGFEDDAPGTATDDPKFGAPCNLHPAYWLKGKRVEL